MSRLSEQILELIQSSVPIPDDQFTALVHELLSVQRAGSPFIDRYFGAMEVPAKPVHYTEMVGLPTSAFKRTSVRPFPEDRTLTYFQTSGTTEGESGRHYFETLDFYEAAILPNFKAHLVPDCDRMPMLILTPPPEETPHSSLVHMMKVVRERLGTEESDYYLREGRLQFDELLAKVLELSRDGQPVFLLGTAFAFIYFLDALAERNERLELPPGSRIMETGGFKGRTREVARDDFYAMLSNATAVPIHRIVNEYGMTELSSQFYDVSLAQSSATAQKSVPPWTRVVCVDPMTNAPVPEGTPGLIRIYDLANIGSCCVLQTEDVGVRDGDRFEVHGRVPMASPRGCSLAVEELLG